MHFLFLTFLLLSIFHMNHGEGQVYRISKLKLSYSDALKYCQKRGMDLVKINNDEENIFLYKLALKKQFGKYWINGNDINKEGVWVDSDNKELSYKNWYFGEPNNYKNSEDCIEGFRYSNKYWNDADCNDANTVICQPSENNFYVASRQMDFAKALKYCKRKRMELVRIDNTKTNDRIYNFAVNNSLGKYWINGNDINKEGVWVDSDNNELSYKKWYYGEPNNYKGNENCIQGLRYSNGYWNDADCGDANTVICAPLSSLTSKANFRVAPEKMEYDDAVNYCLKIGMELVKTDSATTNAVVYNFAVKKTLGTYWINGNDVDKEGLWVDSNNKQLTYKNWYYGEPNNQNNEDCIVGSRFPNGYWNDISCDSKHSVICS